MTVTFDTNPGPYYEEGVALGLPGWPVIPSGWATSGPFAIGPDGSYFGVADVNKDGTVNLHAPPSGWQLSVIGSVVTVNETVIASHPTALAIPANIPQGSKLGPPDPKNPGFFNIVP